MGSKILTFEEIVNADDLTRQTLDMPEWGGSVVVRELTKHEQQGLRKAARKDDGEIDTEAFERLLVIAGVAEPTISDAQYNLLVEKSAKAVDRIIKTVSELSGMASDSDGEEEGGVVADAAKEFPE